MAGAKTYHGTPCKRCGGTERYMKRNCVACTKAKAAERQKADPEAYSRRRAAWTAKNTDYLRNWRRQHKYGLTAEAFKELLEAQGGRCPGCLTDITAGAVVDHDHSTGAVRGLLCSKCNIGIGHLNDSPSVLVRLARYLANG